MLIKYKKNNQTKTTINYDNGVRLEKVSFFLAKYVKSLYQSDINNSHYFCYSKFKRKVIFGRPILFFLENIFLIKYLVVRQILTL